MNERNRFIRRRIVLDHFCWNDVKTKQIRNGQMEGQSHLCKKTKWNETEHKYYSHIPHVPDYHGIYTSTSAAL